MDADDRPPPSPSDGGDMIQGSVGNPISKPIPQFEIVQFFLPIVGPSFLGKSLTCKPGQNRFVLAYILSFCICNSIKVSVSITFTKPVDMLIGC